MQYLPKNKMYKFNPDTLVEVRKAYNLHKPGEMKDAVDILKEWVQQQDHFTKKDFSRSYLERRIIGCKGSIERAKERLDKICTFRTLMPQYFGDFDVKNDFKALNAFTYAPIPTLTQDHRRLITGRSNRQKFATNVVLEIFRTLFLITEYCNAHDYATGYIIFVDCLEFDWVDFISKMHVNEIRQGFAILLGGYEARISSINILTNSNLVDITLAIIKPFLGAKISSRISVHSTLDTIYDIIPKELLPVEYGGKEKPLKVLHDEFLDVLSSKEQREYVSEICTARTDESLRQNEAFNEIYLGTPGTFRTLNVD